MTATTTTTAPAPAPASLTAPSLLRLTRVELRKMVDTRAGLWLLVMVAALTIAAVALVVAFGNGADRTFASLLSVAVQPPGYLLPVVGILLITSEFTQRTALITFALVPRRARVVVAKLLAAIALAVAAYATALAVAGIAWLVSGRSDAAGSATTAGLLGQDLLFVVVGMVTGLAFGLAARTSAPAIVAYFLVPIAWTLLGEIPALEGAWEWLDPARSLELLVDRHLDSGEWARAVTSLGLFIVVPLAIGIARMRREELP